MKEISKIERSLRESGLSRTELQVSTLGRWTTSDAEWNYFDVPHLNIVHSKVDGLELDWDDNSILSLVEQRIGPICFRTLLTVFRSGSDSVGYLSSVGPFLLVVESKWMQISDEQTKVDTKYQIYSSRFFKPFHKMVKIFLTRNYRRLMSEDIPMRIRRNLVRSAGHDLLSDSEPHSFIKSRRITQENVRLSKKAEKIAFDISIQKVLNSSRTYVGNSFTQGVMLVNNGNVIYIFPRLCLHEGACLDDASQSGHSVQCPWHGRAIPPLAEISLQPMRDETVVVRISTQEIVLNFRGDR